jgi:hypothetical protein
MGRLAARAAAPLDPITFVRAVPWSASLCADQLLPATTEPYGLTLTHAYQRWVWRHIKRLGGFGILGTRHSVPEDATGLVAEHEYSIVDAVSHGSARGRG